MMHRVIRCVIIGITPFLIIGCGLTSATPTPGMPRQTPVSVIATPREQAVSFARPTPLVNEVMLPSFDPLDFEGEINVTGSATVFPLLEQAYRRFVRDGYRGLINIDRTGTVIAVDEWCGTSEDPGIQRTDIIMASRPLSASETRRCLDAGTIPVQLVIARDELTIFVNNENEFAQRLTLEQIPVLFTAERWSDINPDWPNRLIRRYIPDETSGTLEWFVEQVFDGDPTPLNIAPNLSRSSNPSALVYGVNTDIDGLGFASRALVTRTPNQVRVVSIVDPDALTRPVAVSGTGPLSRDLYIYADLYAIRARPELGAFLSYILDNIQRETFDVGYLPPHSAVLNETRRRVVEALRGDMRVSGSTTVAPLAEAARQRFVQLGYDGFVQLEGNGSGAGLEELCVTLTNDIAIASREINEEEIAACTSNDRPPIEFRLATDAFVFAVNRGNTFLQEVTYEDIIAIYEAERWSDVNPDWPNAEIVHYMFGPETGGIGVLADEIYEGDEEAPLRNPNVTPVQRGIEMAQLVAEDVNAIGVMALPFYFEFEDRIRALPVNGVEATPEMIENGEYPLARALFAYTDAATVHSHPQVSAYLYTLLHSLPETAPATGFFAPSEQSIDSSIELLADMMAG